MKIDGATMGQVARDVITYLAWGLVATHTIGFVVALTMRALASKNRGPTEVSNSYQDTNRSELLQQRLQSRLEELREPFHFQRWLGELYSKWRLAPEIDRYVTAVYPEALHMPTILIRLDRYYAIDGERDTGKVLCVLIRKQHVIVVDNSHEANPA